MPRRPLTSREIPTLIDERLRIWGATIRMQRVVQKVTAADLCQRIDISRPTLQRLERGDAGVSVAHYLTAFHALGLLDKVAPAIPAEYWQATTPAPRARPASDDDEYF